MIEILIAVGVFVLFLLIIVIVKRKRAAVSKSACLKQSNAAPVNEQLLSAVAATPKEQASLPDLPNLTAEPKSIYERVSEIVDTPQTAPLIYAEHLPQDFQLRRHYVTHLTSMLLALKQPRPSELSLSRHFDALIASELDDCLHNAVAVDCLVARYDLHRKNAVQHTSTVKAVVEFVVEPVVELTAVVTESASESPMMTTQVPVTIAQPKTSILPEDSTLRRHALTQLYATVEACLPPRPTDYTLRRHYEGLFNAELEKLLW